MTKERIEEVRDKYLYICDNVATKYNLDEDGKQDLVLYYLELCQNKPDLVRKGSYRLYGYGEEASCLDWVLKVISSLNSYQNQVVEEMEKLTQNLSTVDREICDELHYIEFCNLNAAEGYKSYKRLKELQQKRRAIKNSFEMLDAVQVVVSGVSKIEKMVTDPAKKSYTLREPETFIHDWRG